MTPSLEQLRALAMAATPGPWISGHDPSHYGAPEVTDGKTFAYYVPDKNDAAFIAAASPDVVLALLDRLATVEGACRELAWTAEKLAGWLNDETGRDAWPGVFERIEYFRKVADGE